MLCFLCTSLIVLFSFSDSQMMADEPKITPQVSHDVEF
jgi:hypothetical protein